MPVSWTHCTQTEHLLDKLSKSLQRILIVSPKIIFSIMKIVKCTNMLRQENVNISQSASIFWCLLLLNFLKVLHCAAEATEFKMLSFCFQEKFRTGNTTPRLDIFLASPLPHPISLSYTLCSLGIIFSWYFNSYSH